MILFFKLRASLIAPLLLGLTFLLAGCGFERVPKPAYVFSSGDAIPEEYSFEEPNLQANAVDIAAIQQFNKLQVSQQPPKSSNDLAAQISAIADSQIIAPPMPLSQNLSQNQLRNLPQALPQVAKQPQLAARTVTQQETMPASSQNTEAAIAAQIAKLKTKASPRTQELYQVRGNKPLWYRNGQWIGMATSASKSLSNSDHDGLPKRRYQKFGSLSLGVASTAGQIAATDIALTEASQLYLVDLSDGLDPEKKRADGRERLLSALRMGDWETYTSKLRPKNQQYVGLSRVMQSGALTGDQRKTVMINMERFRAYQKPTDPRFIHVNLPTQSLTGYQQSRPAIDMPVVIGQLSRQTPVMKDKITNLKFSPDWSVPQSIAKKDLFPILKAKGSELTKAMGINVYKGSRKIDPDKEDFSNASASSYRFHQPPGPKNALGGVRFSLTNPRGIYLHDTPSRDLFSRSTRVVSSGCVRVGDAKGLATWLMKGTSWDQAKIDKAMKRGKTQIVELERDVPVYFTYHTAHVDSKGKFEMGADIYALDAALGIRLGIY